MADFSITATSVIPSSSANIQKGTAGGTITAGMPVYKDSSDSNKIKPADADADASSNAVGIAVTGAASGQVVYYVTNDSALELGLADSDVGKPLFVSTTAGGICPWEDLATGDYATFLGMVSTGGTVKMNITRGGVIPA